MLHPSISLGGNVDKIDGLPPKLMEPNWKKKLEQGNKNHSSRNGGSLRIGGFMSIIKYMRRMVISFHLHHANMNVTSSITILHTYIMQKAQIGRNPSFLDFFKHTHKKKESDDFVDHTSPIFYVSLEIISLAMFQYTNLVIVICYIQSCRRTL